MVTLSTISILYLNIPHLYYIYNIIFSSATAESNRHWCPIPAVPNCFGKYSMSIHSLLKISIWTHFGIIVAEVINIVNFCSLQTSESLQKCIKSAVAQVYTLRRGVSAIPRDCSVS